jgi:hypothetical protein
VRFAKSGERKYFADGVGHFDKIKNKDEPIIFLNFAMIPDENPDKKYQIARSGGSNTEIESERRRNEKTSLHQQRLACY